MSSKRSSLEDDFTPQLKRLSFDESKDYRQSVYEKTKKLLYEGARFNSDSRIHDRSLQSSKNAEKSEKKHKLKQIVLDNKCQLDNKHFIYNPTEYSPMLPEKCTFCERLRCFTPLYQCNKCQEHFCSKCSLSTYASKQEMSVCLSCFK